MQVNEPYYRFILMVDTTEDAEEKNRLARKAFLHIIATRNACEFQKVKVLEKILEKCPNVLVGIDDDTMVEALEDLRDGMRGRGMLISTPELEWTNKYLRTKSARQQVERIVYRSMLLGSSHWDKARHEYNWTISNDTRGKLILNAIEGDDLGAKRKIELAEEIGIPAARWKRLYLRKLLWDGHYDKAAEIGMQNEGDVLAVVEQNLNAGYFSEAQEIVKRFLPNRLDLIEEIGQIVATLLRF